MSTSPAVYTDRKWARKQTFLQLAERVEGGETSWRTTLEIECAIKPGTTIFEPSAFAVTDGVVIWRPQAYPTSADAGFNLIPPGWFVVHFSDDGPRGAIQARLACRTRPVDVESIGAPTRAAAITAAALRAWAREEG